MQPSNHQVSLSQKQNMIRHSVVRASDQIKEGHGFESHLGSDSFPSLHFMQKTYHILKLRRFFYLTRSIQRITRLRRIILLQCEIAIETHFLLSILLALPNRPPSQPPSNSQETARNQFRQERVGKSRGKLTMFWLGNENEFWFEKRDSQPLCCQSLVL